MNQERSLRVSPATMQPIIMVSDPRENNHDPTVPYQRCRHKVFTPPMPLATDGIRLLTQPTENIMLPSAFQGEGCR